MARPPLLYIFLMSILSGCSTAKTWSVVREQNRGVVGYQNYSSPESATKAVDAQIKQHCRTYRVTRDEIRSKDYQTTGVMPVTTYSTTQVDLYAIGHGSIYGDANTQSTTYVPYTQNKTASWREATYECTATSFGSNYGSASERSPGSHAGSANVLTDPVGSKAYCKVFATGAGSCDFDELQKCQASIQESDEVCLPRNP